jgi:hypothetical protein
MAVLLREKLDKSRKETLILPPLIDARVWMSKILFSFIR